MVSPRVPSTVLDDDITLLEMNGFAVIELKPHLPLENDGIINCICLVHGPVSFFEVVRKPPQPAQSLFMRGLAIKRRIFETGTGRKGNDMKACPSRPRNDGRRVTYLALLR